MTHFLDVREFSEKFGLLVNYQPTELAQQKLRERIEFMQEELNEFIVGVATQDLVEQADALVDLVYVALGTANMLGLPWQELWDDVHHANMQKVRGIGKRGYLIDCIKPLGWSGPKTSEILERARRD